MSDPKSKLPIIGQVAIIDTDGNELNVNPNGTISAEVTGQVSITPAQVADLKNVSVDNFPTVQPVSGPLTNTELRADPVPVTGAVNATVTGVATEAKQNAGNASLASIDTKLTNPLAIRGLTFASDKVDATGSTVAISNFPAVQPVSGPLTNFELRFAAVPVSLASIPLPTGASTEAKQDAGNNYLASIDNKLTAPILIQGALTNTELRATPVPVLGNVAVSNFPSSQNVVVTSSALPPGASTLAAQNSGNALLSSINSFVSSIDSKLTSPLTVTGPLTDIQLRAAPVPVSGTVTANLGTIAGVATEVTLAALSAKIPTGLTVKSASTPAVATDQALVVTLSPNNPIVVSAITGEVEISNDTGNPIPIAATALPLPAGASTATKQDTGNSNLASIDSKLSGILNVAANNLDIRDLVFATDKVDVSASVVALDSATISQLQNITVTISNEVEIKNDAGNPVPVLGNVAVSNFPSSQNVVVTSSVLPTGAAISSLQTSGNSSLSSIDAKLSSALTVVGPLTDAQLRASAVPIIGTVTANLGTIGNAATETSLNAFSSKIPTGLTVKAPSTAPVAADPALVVTISPNSTINATLVNTQVEISNDFGNPIPVNGIVTANLGTIGNTATESTLAGVLTTSAFQSRINTQGQKIMAASTPVVISLDQSTIPVDVTDRATRELGRVRTSDTTFISETFSTTSSIASTARPINGDFNVRNLKTKTVVVTNTSAQTGRVTIIASIDNGTTFDVPIVSDVSLVANSTSVSSFETAVTHIRVNVRSNTNGQTTTYTSKAYGLGI